MKTKIILVELFIILIFSTSSTLCYVEKTYYYNDDGFGTFTLSFNKASGTDTSSMLYRLIYYPNGCAEYTVYYYLIGHGSLYYAEDDTLLTVNIYQQYRRISSDGAPISINPTHGEALVSASHLDHLEFWKGADTNADKYGIGTLLLKVSGNPIDLYYATGTTECIDKTELYILSGSDYVLINNASSSSYNFTILEDEHYRLSFDGANYDFICDGDINYDYDGCLYIYGYTCNINSISLWKYEGDSWVYQGVASQWIGYDTYEMQIEDGYNYRLNFSDGHKYFFTCTGDDVRYDWDRCAWVYPPSPYQPPEILQPILGYDNNIVFMRDSHGNFIKNSQIYVYNKANQTYNQKWTDTTEPYVLLAANNDSEDDVIVMCRTFDGIFTLETTDPAFGTDENITWTNWTIPIMYNLEIRPIDQSNVPLHDVFVSMYEYTPLDPLSFFGYDTYWGHTPITNCSGFSRCDIVAEKDGYADYNITGLNWTSKSAMIKDYKQDIVMVKE